MKKVVCSGDGCQERRTHWCDPDTPRGPQMVEVPDDWPEGRPVYCSMTCAIMSGYMTLKYTTNPCPKCLAQGIKIEHHGDYKCWQPEVT